MRIIIHISNLQSLKIVTVKTLSFETATWRIFFIIIFKDMWILLHFALILMHLPEHISIGEELKSKTTLNKYTRLQPALHHSPPWAYGCMEHDLRAANFWGRKIRSVCLSYHSNYKTSIYIFWRFFTLQDSSSCDVVRAKIAEIFDSSWNNKLFCLLLFEYVSETMTNVCRWILTMTTFLVGRNST